MMRAAPHLPTAVLLIGTVTLYSATPATAELERVAPSVSAGFMEVPALLPDVRIGLGVPPGVQAAFAGRQAAFSSFPLAYGGHAPFHAVPVGPPLAVLGGGLELGLAEDSTGQPAGLARPGFASAISASGGVSFLPAFRAGAWVARVDFSAIDLGRPVRGHVRPGGNVPAPEQSVLQIALAF